MKNILLALAFFFTLIATGQIKVTGTVVDDTNTPIPFANILVLSSKDSSLIKGFPVSDGKFEIKQNEVSFMLKIFCLGYSEHFIQINKSADLGEIILKPISLKGVEITSEKLAFEIDEDIIKINVSNSIFESSSSVGEILSKSPGVVVSGTDISVIGRGDALVYIDNKLSTVDALKATPVSQIKTIEIIRNPDASYEAAGMAVILVHLKELGLNGFQGKILSHYTKAFYQLGYFDASLNWHLNKITVRASGNTNFGSTGVVRYDHLKTNTASPAYTADTDFKEKTYLDFVSNYLLGMKYQLNTKQSISFEYNGNYSPYVLDVNTNISQNFDAYTKQISSNDLGISIWKTNIFSMNYIWKYDSLGSNVFFGATHSSVLTDYADSINENSISQSTKTISNSISEGNNLDKISIGQIDFTKNFKNGSKLKMGLKYSDSESSTYVNFKTERNDSIVNSITNSFIYEEDISSAYINWKGKWKKGSFELGTRLERTSAKAKEISQLENYIDTNYVGFFPNISVTTQLKNWTSSERINFKIHRPSFGELSPYIYYLNSFTAVRGNPNLTPTYVYAAEQSFTNNKWGSTIRLGLNHERDPIVFTLFQNDTSETSNVLKRVNINQSNQVYLELGQSINLKGITGYNMLNISLTKMQDNTLDFGDTRVTPKLYFYSYIKIPIKKWFNFELLGSFTSAHADGRQTLLASGDIGFGLSKSFGKNKWFAQISVNDIFQTSKYRVEINQDGNFNTATAIGDNRFLRCTLSYKFGKLKHADYNHSNINDEELKRTN